MRHMNRCNVLHFAMMKATTGQEGEPAMGPATGNFARGDLRNDYYAKHSGINKGGRTLEELMPKSGSPMRYGVAVAGAGQPSPISWLDSPGDLVRLKFSNI